jgi:hypothetical protein
MKPGYSNIKSIAAVFLTALMLLISEYTYCQTINTKFGKNRVQFHDDFNDWWSYDTDHYTVFWYGKERNIAKTVILLTQISYDDIEEIVDYKMNRKIQIIVYSNLSDMKQSNLGIKESEESESPGITKFYENKVLVYFNGDHNDLLRQIREGTAKVFLYNMFGGLSYENIYKRLLISNFPKWFNAGSVKYLSRKWDYSDDEILRKLFLTKNSKKLEFKRFSEKLPDLAGKSFFYFLEKQYGTAKISDLFYLIRISRDIRSSFPAATGKSANELYAEWKHYFTLRYHIDKQEFETQDKLKAREIKSGLVPYTSLAVSEEAGLISYTTNRKGRAEVFLKDGKNTKRVFKLGYVNTAQETDYSYPLAFFNNSGKALGLIYEKRNELILRTLDTENYEFEEHIISPEYRKIYAASYLDQENLILNADVDGFNDLFKYNLRKRQSVRLTEDFWDDLDAKPAVMNGVKGIVFASNRAAYTAARQLFDTIVPLGKFDICFLNLTDNSVINLTSTPDIDERKPDIQNDLLYYISDESGIRNIKTRNLVNAGDETFVTNSESSVDGFIINGSKYLYSSTDLCDNILLSGEREDSGYKTIPQTYFRRNQDFGNKLMQPDLKPQFNYTYMEIDSGLMFQSKFRDIENLNDYNSLFPDTLADKKQQQFRFSPFLSYRAIASRLKFSFSEIITRLDNEALFEGMENYSQDQNSYVPPAPGLLVKSIVKDMFEDHYLETGFRISTDLRQKEYFWVYENLKSRIDWQYAFYRKSRSDYDFSRVNIVDKTRFITNLVQVQAKYSFDTYRSFKLISRIQADKNITGASDTFSLNKPDIAEQRISLRAEYVFDNTSRISANLMEGNRSKFFIEGYNRFGLDFKELSQFDISKGIMAVIGFDTRQYFKILDKSIAALRLAGQTSFGNESNLYILGGLENWYFSKQSDLVPYPESDNFAFKVLAANMRGFGYNARNGSSFLVFNGELRFPVFQYILGQDIKNSFIRDFQFNVFYDMGLAWYGSSPFSDDNPSNYRIIDIPPSIKLKIRYYSDPLIAGFGFGMRSSLFGYFIKLDYAWGIETRTIQKPMLYFSIGYDF